MAYLYSGSSPAHPPLLRHLAIFLLALLVPRRASSGLRSRVDPRGRVCRRISACRLRSHVRLLCSFIDVLKAFNEDAETKAIVLIGEIGGNEEEKAAIFAEGHIKKPIIGFIPGQSAPLGKRMGHAGAIISAGEGLAQYKIEAFKKAGIHVALIPSEIGLKVKEALAV